MKNIIIRLILTFLSVAILTSCSTTTKVDRIGTALNSRENDCKVEFYKDSKPSKQYIAIGKIESHVMQHYTLGALVNLDDDTYKELVGIEDTYKELSQKACEIGGEAVIVDDYMETSAAEMTHVHVWATVIKYQ